MYFLQVKTIFIPTGVSLTSELCAPLVATLPLEVIFPLLIIFDPFVLFFLVIYQLHWN